MFSEQLKEKVSVLLVDDKQRNLDVLRAILSGLDYHLVEATSGSEALACLQHNEFAVVLLDVMMPAMDGFECAKLIRATRNCTHTPIIFVSAVADEMDFIYKGYNSGAVDYIVKPFNPAVLKAKVAIFADLFRTKKILIDQLHEARALCHKLEVEKAHGNEEKKVLLDMVHDFAASFEERLKFNEAITPALSIARSDVFTSTAT
ncbi:MAG TPA: response regulator [Oligoflexus sp.]|uniref:response regulator n=1 Tax=Oligoflexus sp. TaxID=1971216 RepID=UPI002D3B5975|nr:response regulator [Oligoflexus sp.]HYX33930.1 response regulator [Oligoflexus sp.]